MISKYKLWQMGLDQFDSDRRYKNVLNQIKPNGKSNFREAYAFGIGMMLDFNKEYLMINDLNNP